jgi:hypothetical protein
LNPDILNGCVHPGYAEAGCNCFSKSNKASFIEKKTKGGEIRLPFILFLCFLILYYLFDDYFLGPFFYLNLTFLVVLSHAHDTKFMVETLFESSYFYVSL